MRLRRSPSVSASALSYTPFTLATAHHCKYTTNRKEEKMIVMVEEVEERVDLASGRDGEGFVVKGGNDTMMMHSDA